MGLVYVYVLQNTVNNKAYVGVSNDPEVRWANEESNAFNPRSRAYNTLLSKKISPETRELLRAANLGKKRSPEAIANSAAGHRGLKRSPETRARMSAAQKAMRERKRKEKSDVGTP